MQGLDKGLTTLEKKPLIKHVIERIGPQVGRTIISINRNFKTYAQFDLPLVEDRDGVSFGPLSGVHSGLSEIDAEYVLVVPCDTPFLPDDLVARLAAQLIEQDADIAYASDGERSHYAVMLMAARLENKLSRYLQSGGRRVGGWIHEQNHTCVVFDNAQDAFKNFNFVRELSQFNEHLWSSNK